MFSHAMLHVRSAASDAQSGCAVKDRAWPIGYAKTYFAVEFIGYIEFASAGFYRCPPNGTSCTCFASLLNAGFIQRQHSSSAERPTLSHDLTDLCCCMAATACQYAASQSEWTSWCTSPARQALRLGSCGMQLLSGRRG